MVFAKLHVEEFSALDVILLVFSKGVWTFSHLDRAVEETELVVVQKGSEVISADESSLGLSRLDHQK